MAKQATLLGLALLFLYSVIIQGQTSSGPGSVVAYQGHLRDAGLPANGPHDMRAALYNAETGGSRIGLVATNYAVMVNNGLFSTRFDFGPSVFNGEARWLELAVRRVGIPDFTALLPRQAINPVPYAQFAMTPAGPKGEAGPQGIPGPQGSKGDTGATGAVSNAHPFLVSAQHFLGATEVCVMFNEKVDPASATNTQNYCIGSGTSFIYRVGLLSDGTSAVLSVDRPQTNRIAVFVQNIKNLNGDSMSLCHWTLCSLPILNALDVGTKNNSGKFIDPLVPGHAIPLTPKGKAIEVTAGGSGIWGNADGFHFVYLPVTGDFDYWVRVESLKQIDNGSSMAGLMAREKFAASSRHVDTLVTRTGTMNVWVCDYRSVEGGPTASWPGELSRTDLAAAFPNVWLRLKRTGNTFTAYRSIDGVTWSERAKISPTPAYPATLYIGLCTSAGNNDGVQTTTARFQDMQLMGPGGSLLTERETSDGFLPLKE
jgi:hypothetical protein